MAHKCDWCWMTRTALEAQLEVSEAGVAQMDAAGDLGAAQSHADDVATIRACQRARDAAESIPGALATAALRDLTEDVRGARIKSPATKAAALLGALVGASAMRWW